MKKNRKSLSERVADEIYDMIVTEQTFGPGDKLPNENELSEELGVSRATLREAVRSLVAQGVLEVHRGKGTFIAPDMKLCNDFGFRNLERVRVRLRDLLEMRLIFEPQMTALACRRATEEELQSIIEQGRHIEEYTRMGKDRTEVDQLFHKAIVMASHNDFMIRLIPIINRAVLETILISGRDSLIFETSLRDHALIMEFLLARDAQGAKSAMAIHIHHIISGLSLAEDGDPIL